MYELIQAGENTFYMDCPSKVGFFRTSANEAVIIDSGSDRDAGKKVKKILDAQGWKLKAVFNTHSHADHIGGNNYLQSVFGCKIYARGAERCFTEYPFLEPVALFGGYPFAELRNKFLMAKESCAEELTEEALPEGLEMISLPGHCYDMVGFRTADDVVFLADSLASAETIEKYRIGYLYDVKAYLDTLEAVENMEAAAFVPSHADATDDIAPLARLNTEKTKEIAEMITGLVASPKTFDELLSDVFGSFGLTMTLQQNLLVGSAVKSYLAYLKNEGKVTFAVENNRLLWQTV